MITSRGVIVGKEKIPGRNRSLRLRLDKYELVDSKGNVEEVWNYYKIYSFTKGVAAVEKNSRFGAIDTYGKRILPLKYENAKVTEHNIRLRSHKLWGFADHEGNIIRKPEFNFLEEFTTYEKLGNSFARFQVNERWGIIDIHGNIVVEPRYELLGILDPTKELVVAKTFWGYGAIDLKGNVKIKFGYKRCSLQEIAKDTVLSEGNEPDVII